VSRRRSRKIVDTQTYILFVETDVNGAKWISIMLPDGQRTKMYDNELRAEAFNFRVVEAVTSINSHGCREIESIDSDVESAVQLYKDAGWSEKEMKRKDIKVDKIVMVDF